MKAKWSNIDVLERAIVVAVGALVVFIGWVVVFQSVIFAVCGCSP